MAPPATPNDSAVFGQSLTSSVTQLGKALEDPIQGISALRRVGVSFNATQREMIEEMVKAGDVAGAQKLILETLAKQVGGAGEAEASGLAGAFDRAKDAVDEFLKGIVEITGVAGASRSALEGIAGGIESVNNALFTERPIGEQVVAANRAVIEAQDRLAGLEERHAGMTGRTRAVAEMQAERLRDAWPRGANLGSRPLRRERSSCHRVYQNYRRLDSRSTCGRSQQSRHPNRSRWTLACLHRRQSLGPVGQHDRGIDHHVSGLRP